MTAVAGQRFSMSKNPAARTVTLLALVVGGSVWVYASRGSWGRRSAAGEAETGRAAVEAIAAPLSADHRAAKVLVLGRREKPAGVATTSCLFSEYAPDGRTLVGTRKVEVIGPEVLIETRTLRFSSGVGRNDALRGKHLTLFVQAASPGRPASEATALDTPAEAPSFYRGEDPVTTAGETAFWSDAWKASDDPAAATKTGRGGARWDGSHPVERR